MRIEEWDQIHEMVVDAAGALFSSIGLSSRYVGAVPHREARWSETIAIIGLAGAIRGSLVVSMPTQLVEECHPTHATSPEDLADWIAEIANLLLGRVKSHLLSRGVSIALSTPITLTATAFRFERFVGTPVVHEFKLGDDTMHVAFEAVSDPDVRLMPARADAAVAAGEVITF